MKLNRKGIPMSEECPPISSTGNRFADILTAAGRWRVKRQQQGREIEDLRRQREIDRLRELKERERLKEVLAQATLKERELLSSDNNKDLDCTLKPNL